MGAEPEDWKERLGNVMTALGAYEAERQMLEGDGDCDEDDGDLNDDQDDGDEMEDEYEDEVGVAPNEVK